MAANKSQTNIDNVLQVNDISRSIFGFVTKSPDRCEKEVVRLRAVDRSFDEAVRLDQRHYTLNSDYPHELHSCWPKVDDMFISGTMDYDQGHEPFVFPDPDSFKKSFPALKCVDVYLARVDFTSLLMALSALPHLTNLDVECDWGGDYPNERITTDEEVSSLTVLVQNAPLKRLSLTNRALDTDDSPTPFMNALAVNTTIMYLDLTRSSCSFEDLAHVLRTNRTIVEITFNIPDDDSEAVTPIAEVLAHNENTTLKSFALLGSNIPIIADAMKTNTTLESLEIGPFDDSYEFNKLSMEDLACINDMLAVNKTLTSLEISGNHRCHVDFDEESGEVNMSSLLINTTLRTLRVTGFCQSRERSELITDICTKLGRNTSGVTCLELDCYANNLDGLSGNTTLSTLALSVSDFDMDEHAVVFVSMTSLTLLDLRFCRGLTRIDDLIQQLPNCKIITN